MYAQNENERYQNALIYIRYETVYLSYSEGKEGDVEEREINKWRKVFSQQIQVNKFTVSILFSRRRTEIRISTW